MWVLGFDSCGGDGLWLLCFDEEIEMKRKRETSPW